MNPENVRPHSFKKHTIIYNDGHFSVAYGEDSNGNTRLAVRWNGGGNNVGYPSQGGHPLWFQLPDYGTWTADMLEIINKMKKKEELLNELDTKINSII